MCIYHITAKTGYHPEYNIVRWLLIISCETRIYLDRTIKSLEFTTNDLLVQLHTLIYCVIQVYIIDALSVSFSITAYLTRWSMVKRTGRYNIIV